MIKNCIYLAMCVWLLSGCAWNASTPVHDRPSSPALQLANSLFSRLELEIDRPSIEAAFTVVGLSIDRRLERVPRIYTVYSDDAAIRNSISIFRREFGAKVSGDTKHGYIVCKIKDASVEGKPRWGWALLSLATCLTANCIFGAPTQRHEAQIATEILILNRERNVVAEYSERGISSAYQSYHRRMNSPGAAEELAYSKALLSATAKTKWKIRQDMTRLRERLEIPSP